LEIIFVAPVKRPVCLGGPFLFCAYRFYHSKTKIKQPQGVFFSGPLPRKSGKGLSEKRAREPGLRAEGFFRLDFLVLFNLMKKG